MSLLCTYHTPATHFRYLHWLRQIWQAGPSHQSLAVPNLWNFYELVLTDLQTPSEWEIGSKTNLQKALFLLKKILLNLRMLALLQGLLIKLCQKANYRQLAVEFWTPAFLRNREGIQYLNKKCTMTFRSHIGKIMYQIFHSCGDTNASRCLCCCRSRTTEKQWLKATR